MHSITKVFWARVTILVSLWLGLSPVHAQSAREPLGQCSRLTSLVISEIMYHPPARPDAKDLQFIEIFNALPTPEDLTGYRLAGDVNYVFPSGTSIPGRGFLVVAKNPGQLQEVYNLAVVLGPFEGQSSLPTNRGTVRLRNRAGAVFLEVNYSSNTPWPVRADGAGHSLVLAWPSLGEGNPKAWSASDGIGGSPGVDDPVTSFPQRAVLINEFLAHTDDPELDYVELYNHSNQPVDLAGCVLTDDPSTNKFVLPSDTIVPARGFLSFDQNTLGFALNAGGETLYFKDAGASRVLDAVRFGGQENGVATGRAPDGGPEWYRLESKTPGITNASVRVSDVVLNEIMYHPISEEDDDQYLEIYNRSAQAVNLGGWQLTDGVSFTFPSPTIIPPDGYLVVAKNAVRLLTNHPGLSQALGNFDGKLAGGGERIALTMPDIIVATNQTGALETNAIQIVVDEVTYHDGGRWGQWSDGGGSSLERIDPRADGGQPSNWADSDETSKGAWTEISFTGRLDNGNVSADQLQVLLQGAGECLIDNVEVTDASGVNQVANGTFESNATGWTAEGTEDQSGWETTQGYQSAASYHVRAVDRGDNQLNRIRTPLRSALPSGSTATIRAQVRWLKGCPNLLLRLRGNWLEAAGTMALPGNLGTPGGRNGRFALNGAPAIVDVSHSPIVPAAGESVVVTARASDPDGIAALELRYRLDPVVNYTVVPMTDDGTNGDAIAGDGLFSATIPAPADAGLVAFYIQATDSLRKSSTFPDRPSSGQALIRFGESTPAGNFPIYRIWMTQSTFNTWSSRNKLNNTPLPVTFVLGNTRVIHNARALYAGSPYIAPGYSTPSGNRCGYSVSFPSDDRFLGNTDLVLDWPGGHGGENSALQEQMAYWMADKMGLPYSHRYHIRLQVNGVTDLQRGTVFEAVNQPAGDFLNAWVPDDSNGDFYKIDRAFEFSDGGQLTADPQPRLQNYTTTGGVKKTARYRWTWLKRSTAAVNDYTNIFQLVDALTAAQPEPYTSQTEALVDVEEWLGILALEHIIVNFDAYGHEIGKNMYAYKPRDGRWQLYLFDLDWLMLAAAGRGASYAASSASLFNSEDPTMSQMYRHPPFRRAFFRAVKNAVDGPMLSTICNPVMDAKYQALVANGVTRCDGQTLAAPTAVKTWFSQRRAYLVTQLNAIAAEFAITSRGGNDFTTNASLVTLTGTAPVEVKGLRVNGTQYPVTWTSINEWAITLALPSGRSQIMVEAYDVNGTVLPDLKDQISIESQAVTESPVDRIVINEILAQPAIDGAEFIELSNASTTTGFDLSGWRINGVDFTFPNGSLIRPGAYLVVAKDRGAFLAAYGNSVPIAGEFQGNLDSDGETLSLVQPGTNGAATVVVDSVTYGTTAPWPASGPGASLQLIDATQDNFRVANWAMMSGTTDPTGSPQWRYVTATGTASSSRLYIYMGSAGEVFVDDLQIVAGEQPGTGVNEIIDGGFEADFPGSWNVSGNLTESSASAASRHTGDRSLHVVATSPGSSRDTSIWQDIGPLVNDAPYTLSYWFLPSTNGSDLTIRLSGNGISSSHSIAPTETPQLLSTPGVANSVRASLPALAPLWINEVCPGNVTGFSDNAGDRDPWVELFNTGESTVSLEGWFLADSFTNLTQWAFPSVSAIGPRQTLLVWLDGETEESTSGAPHANFRIPPTNGALALVAPLNGQPTVLDYVNYGAVTPDRSLGLYPDGQGGPRQSFYFPTPGATNNNAAAPLPLFINEWMAANANALLDPTDDAYDDWFEIYNPNDGPVDLGYYWLSDNLTNEVARWKIPAGTTVAARGFLLVWADNDTDQNSATSADLHAGFRLSQEGEAIALFASDGHLVDSVQFGPQTENVSQGRNPDGNSAIVALAAPTPRASNGSSGNPPPEIQPPVLSSTNELVLSWTAQPGRTYRIQMRTDLNAAAWTDLGDLTATAAVASWRTPLVDLPRSFYRVVLLPP